ncbi:hypothetical protein CSKR_110815 [Clonorchis sinensis]|uniref:Uncharacterized protein n=1 Tax=Clonorchis sinensis TaxID=79923 RepID=A0A3R7C2X1_CLOSI|nr:hypothetical protein CSKR_110815 [Clonorchis sinensis]
MFQLLKYIINGIFSWVPGESLVKTIMTLKSTCAENDASPRSPLVPHVPDSRSVDAVYLTGLAACEQRSGCELVRACALLAERVRAILSLTSCAVAKRIELYTKPRKIIHVAIPKPICPDKSYPTKDPPYDTVWLQPSMDHIIRVLQDLARMEKIPRAYLLTDGTSDHSQGSVESHLRKSQDSGMIRLRVSRCTDLLVRVQTEKYMCIERRVPKVTSGHHPIRIAGFLRATWVCVLKCFCYIWLLQCLWWRKKGLTDKEHKRVRVRESTTAASYLIDLDPTLDIARGLLKNVSQKSDNQGSPNMILSAHVYQIDRSPVGQLHPNRPGVQDFESILIALGKASKYGKTDPLINHIYLLTSEPHIEAELVKSVLIRPTPPSFVETMADPVNYRVITNHKLHPTSKQFDDAECCITQYIFRRQEWLKQYFWIFGDRIDISTSHLLRSISKHDSNSMHLGFLRYWPLMNVEDCQLGYSS